MTTIEVERHGLAFIGDDDERARYDFVECRSVARVVSGPPSARSSARSSARVLVEVQQRFGGMAPSALLGGRFVSSDGGALRFDAWCGGDFFEAGASVQCPAQLWQRPFAAGLPAVFGDAVIGGFADADHFPLPAGVMTIDRAGFDEVESSPAVFVRAATLLRCAIAARLYERDVALEARNVIRMW